MPLTTTSYEEQHPLKLYRVEYCYYDTLFNPIRDDRFVAYYHARSAFEAFDMHSDAMGIGRTFAIDINVV